MKFDEKQMRFIMDLGFKVRTLIWSEIADNFPNRSEQGTIFQNTITNMIANIVYDSSSPGKERENLLEIINALKNWMDAPQNSTRVTYNSETKEFTKEDIH